MKTPTTDGGTIASGLVLAADIGLIAAVAPIVPIIATAALIYGGAMLIWDATHEKNENLVLFNLGRFYI